ncbi:hypothetical protein NDU88_003973 [Pleurodeles waltl]|uniref:Uncharacterized protein n=1 Tax=Pleurodeles waltl TaxID=8319 RepID=A0AAV7SHJ9_PLEWA|nr:hypothetical protein NDU88_003973 [Pleurodeles waltl]
MHPLVLKYGKGKHCNNKQTARVYSRAARRCYRAWSARCEPGQALRTGNPEGKPLSFRTRKEGRKKKGVAEVPKENGTCQPGHLL